MAERSHVAGVFNLQTSKLLVVAIIIATAATGALVVTLFASMPSGQAPGPGPNGMPPPPPDLRPLAVISVVTGLFVLSWLAVLVVFARDQVLRQIRATQPPTPPGELGDLLAGLRTEIAADRERDLSALTDRLADLTTEFGERRETDGYLNGMRTAAAEPPEAKVRALRRNPPPR
ncbi:hypothetical protein GCM10010172_11510 [Paractinoplanes ferrugineus]|uniref:Uncharacterized protein n=1 Tax=Paractinoplanes ferrugineus TaxID=113564 RepID=A0A919IVH9_9ACTN|nr:hypothetical protein [Actinoplanes ferrugineus]GIE09715.1 hypothetical protein Afe05nite_15550 [Actinoplanes ferrugineus]